LGQTVQQAFRSSLWAYPMSTRQCAAVQFHLLHIEQLRAQRCFRAQRLLDRGAAPAPQTPAQA
ncbi:MAG: hypothetical protein DI537_51170, partial [Stutzerimonas stutzeri]